MSLLDALEVPAARSRASTSATRRPRVAASSAAPAPVMPPPTTSTSRSPDVAASIARRRAPRRARPRRDARSAHGVAPLNSGRSAVVQRQVPAVQVVVDLAQLGVGLHRLVRARRPSRAPRRPPSGAAPRPAAASIAAPRAVVSTSSGRQTGSPVMWARSSSSRRPFAPPPTQTTSLGGVAGAGDRLDHVAQRQRVALEQRAGQVRAAVRGGHPEPGRARVGVPLRRHRARQRGQPGHAAGARRRALGERVEQLVDVGAARLRARRLRAPELVAEPAVGAARQPAGVLEQPRVRVGVRMQLDHAGRVVRRLGDHRADRLGGAHARRTPTPGSTTPAPSVAAISSPAPEHHQRRAVEARSPRAASRRSGRARRAARPHRREPRRIDVERRRTPRPPTRACAGRAAPSRSAFDGIDGELAGRAPGHPRAGQQEDRGRAVGVGLVRARARRSSAPRGPGSRLQPVSSRSRSGSIRSAAAVALLARAAVAPDQRADAAASPSAPAATSPSSCEPNDSATISRPAVASRSRASVATSAAVHSPGSCSAQPACG